MNINVRQIRKIRRYTEEFQKEIVALFESGKCSVPQIEKLYGISNQTTYRWIYKYSKYNQRGYRVVEKKESHMNKIKDLQQRIKELEQAVGRKQIMIEYLEKIIELAKEEHGIDIKKNLSTGPSKPSKRKKKN